MKWLALLGKELQQHGAAVMGALVLLASVQVISWAVSLYENRLTLMNTVFELAVVPLPLFALFLAGRLVVHDHARGTHEFLVALPIAPAHRVLARFGLGLVVMQGAGMASLAFTALLASRREGLPLGWLAQLVGQEALHLWAWFGVAFGVAHLGRFRWLAWWTLVVLGAFVSTHAPDGPTLSWFGMMDVAVDRTRLDPPWDAVLPAFLWGGGGLLLSLLLASFRGGVLLDRWFQPVTAYQRATLLGAGIAIMVAADALDPLAPLGRDAWASLPAVPAERADVRVAGSADGPLGGLGRDVARELDALGEALGVDAWPPVVLVRDVRALGRPAVRAARTDDEEQARVVRVDLSRPHDDLVQAVLHQALLHRLGDLAGWDDEARWAADGAAAWWMADDGAAACFDGAPAESLPRWLTVGLGPDVAPAVAGAGLAALEEAAGREAVLGLLRDVFAFDRATPVDGLWLRWTTRGDWVARRTGAEATWTKGWAARLQACDPLPPVAVAPEAGQPVASWRWMPSGEVALQWARLDPSLTEPLPDLPVEVLPLEAGDDEAALPGDAEARLVARLAVWDAARGVLRVGPWGRP